MTLKTENRNNGKDALAAFLDSYAYTRHEDTKTHFWPSYHTWPPHYDWHFEHGQLWITCVCGAAWSVVDAEGGESINGFDFEQVSEAGRWF